MKSISEIKTALQTLPVLVRRKLLDDQLLELELEGLILEEAQQEVNQKRKKKPCPYCSGTSVYRRGKQNNVQMYRCNDCNKWYSETTGTALYGIKLKEKWQSYIRCMEKGMSLKKISKEIGISIQTSFDWRHKILSSLVQFEPEQLTNEVECDELELSISHKGNRNLERTARKRSTDFKRNLGEGQVTTVQVVTAVQRDGALYLKAVESKRLTKQEIAKVLDGKLAEDAILITDKHPSYLSYAKDHPEMKHKRLLAKDHVDKNDKSIHLQKVNNTHARLRKFLASYNGVSSKYLQNYLNWFAYTDHIKNSKTTLKQWFLAMLLTDQAYNIFELFKQNAVLIRI